MNKISKSKSLFERAKTMIPGGVNSPVRAFQSVGGNPIFIHHADGAYLYDINGNSYIDLINSWGPMILGHNHPEIKKTLFETISNGISYGTPTEMEVIIAELIIEMVPSVEMVRMVNSGTEATMSAVRLARGFTGREKFIKMEGCYHGHGDSFLIAAGSGAMTTGVPNSAGVTKGSAKDTLLAPFNCLKGVKNLFEQYPNEIAALILEPVGGNMGCVLPKEGYLQGLRELCDSYGAVLIFDEVMTGFRLSKAGAQGVFGVEPDLSTFGKVIGGGLPVGAYGGKKAIMECVSPVGDVYQAGTLSGNPLAVSAGIAMLTYLQNNDVYSQLEKRTYGIVEQWEQRIKDKGYPCTINHIGSMLTLFFTDQKVFDFNTAKSCNVQRFAAFFQEMINMGIYIPPSQFESLFISNAIDHKNANTIVEAGKKALDKVFH